MNVPADNAPLFEPLLTVPEVAIILRKSKGEVYTLIAAGELPCIKLGPRSTRVKPSALAAYIASKSAC